MRYVFGLVFVFSLAIQGMADTVTFQTGFGGYDGTVDNNLFSEFPGESFATSQEVAIDGNDGGFVSQGLIRFDSIFGASTGLIQPGSTIQSATLRLYTNSSFNGPAGRPPGDLRFYRMLQNWGNDSSWNSFGGNGIQADGVEARSTASLILTLAADDAFIDLNVTQDLQAWANGETNLGWGIINTSGDGWDFHSSEFDGISDLPNNINGRPSLSVTFTAVPEPSSMLIAGAALAGIAFRRIRKASAKA